LNLARFSHNYPVSEDEMIQAFPRFGAKSQDNGVKLQRARFSSKESRPATVSSEIVGRFAHYTCHFGALNYPTGIDRRIGSGAQMDVNEPFPLWNSRCPLSFQVTLAQLPPLSPGS
jgi:hypothetical protein